jgi:polar amino acid transport system substrate-binding protein
MLNKGNEVHMRKSPSRFAGLFAVLLVVVLGVFGAAGCGSDDDGGSSGSTSTAADTSAAPAAGAIAVPDEIAGKGTLVVATDPTYAPNEFVERGGTDIVGMDVDLAEAIGEKLGLDVEIQKATFDAIIPGLAARRYDLGMSSFTDTREREATVDFVTYFRAGTSYYKRRGAEDIQSIEDLCGKKVAVEKGTTQATDVQAQSRRCETAGEDAADLQVYPDQNGANLAIQSGRAEYGMADSPVADYIVKQSNGMFESTGEPYGVAPYGIAMPKDSGLQEPVLQAVRALIRDGTYLSILRQWGVEHGAIDDPAVNGATS